MLAVQRLEEIEIAVDQAQEVLGAFGDNALAALRSVIAGAEFFCDYLETASLYLSSGIALGWKPSFERDV